MFEAQKVSLQPGYTMKNPVVRSWDPMAPHGGFQNVSFHCCSCSKVWARQNQTIVNDQGARFFLFLLSSSISIRTPLCRCRGLSSLSVSPPSSIFSLHLNTHICCVCAYKHSSSFHQKWRLNVSVSHVLGHLGKISKMCLYSTIIKRNNQMTIFLKCSI